MPPESGPAAGVVEDSDAMSGREALTRAFMEKDAPAAEPKTDDPAPPAGDAPAAEEKPAAAPTQPDTSKVVESEVARRLQESREKEQAEYERRWREGLPDEAYGRYMRQREQYAAQQAQTVNEVASKFYVEATGNVMANVPELANLTPEAAQKLDARQFQTYGQYVAAMVDHTASVRAEKLAKDLAAKEVEARVTEAVAKAMGEYPRQPILHNGLPASADDGIDFKNMSGRQLMEAGFRSRS